MTKPMRERLKKDRRLARSFARQGALARAANLTPEERSAIARIAGLARQAKRRASVAEAINDDAQLLPLDDDPVPKP